MVDAGVGGGRGGRAAARARRRPRRDRHRVAARRGGVPAAPAPSCRTRRSCSASTCAAGGCSRPTRRSPASAPADALARLADAGAREAIVLDLARVGSGEGPDVTLLGSCTPASRTSSCSRAAACATPRDLRALADAGAAGALVATALHGGAIGADELRALVAALEVLDERGRHVDPRRLLDAAPAGDAVDLEHVVAPVGGAQQVDAGVVGAERRRRPHAQLARGRSSSASARARAPRARFARQPVPTRSIAATTRSPTTSARTSTPSCGSVSWR